MRLTGYNRQYIRSGPLAPDWASSREKAVALVITLLFLSVITFLAVAFLAMTHRSRNSVVAGLDVDTAKSMSDAGLARAQTEIIAGMMAENDLLNYDYMASHNYVSPNAFNTTETSNDVNNVNYDWLINTYGGSGGNPTAWAENIANLYYDPRPPVFVPINYTASGYPIDDFRFWVDVNRNGRFETNGGVQVIDPTGTPLALTNWENGEPEWIGILKYPEYVHSPTNPFVGRYAYMVLPIGKTLDVNFIGNHSKFSAPGGGGDLAMADDGYIRDQGVGSWELNLAATINDLGPMYQTNNTASYPSYAGFPYNYIPSAGNTLNPGLVNLDATRFLAFRYGNGTLPANYPSNISYALGLPSYSLMSNIDEYGIYPLTGLNSYGQIDYSGYPALDTATPWPGVYSSNTFYDPQDFFDTTKVGANFVSNMTFACSQIDTTNRYTFQRMLSSIGMGSEPEYGVYVYPDSTNIATAQPQIPQILRTKVNVNYDNTTQIQTGPYDSYGKYTPMPTVLTNWSAEGFFTNAAESLLRSQIFAYTNYVPNIPGPGYSISPSNVYMTFGMTNIPVYSAANPGIVYNDQVHRMLQLAANIYAAAHPAYLTNVYGQAVPQPPVFRPLFHLFNPGTTNALLDIVGYTNVTGLTAYNQIYNGFWKDVTNSVINTNDNIWGIPWVVGAVKGIPQFDQYDYNNQVVFDRKLTFVRYSAGNGLADTNKPPQFTNQFYELQISNVCGMDVWNPYTNAFYGSSGSGIVVAMASNLVTVVVTNNYNWGTNIYVTNVQYASNIMSGGPWTGWVNENAHITSTGQFKNFLVSTNLVLPTGYFSDSTGQFVIYTTSTPTFLASDTNQVGHPTHHWTVSVTNRLFYALFDGPANVGNVLDFVNLGPFGSSFPISDYLSGVSNEFVITPSTDLPNSPFSQGVLQQIGDSETGASTLYITSLAPEKNVANYSASTGTFGPPNPLQPKSINVAYGPTAIKWDTNGWTANDPLVHYTVQDLTYPVYSHQILDGSLSATIPISIGKVSKRYTPWPGPAGSQIQGSMLFMDPSVTGPDAWQFPNNYFPNVGWIGRVHRGTPWQTVYLKADNPNNIANPTNQWITWVNSPLTYPTSDWPLIDLFTAVPNDNAARGLLSVNQTNDAAWAAVFAGVIALNSPTNGSPINPTTDVYSLVDATNGINAVRRSQPNQLFHNIGDFLATPALTTQSPFTTGTPLTDEMVERIPQQTLGLLKLGLPQFVIYSWGQSLRPKQLYSALGASDYLNNICTNYEITGEYKTRTVCHVIEEPYKTTPVVTPTSFKIIVDGFNIEQGN